MLDARPKGRGFEPHRRLWVLSLSKNINPSLVLVQPRKILPYITENLLMGRKESNQTKLNLSSHISMSNLTLNAPITTKGVCFSRLLKCLRSLYGKQCGPRSDRSSLFWVHAVCYRSSLIWVHTVCLYPSFVSYIRQLVAADDFSRRQNEFFLGVLKIKTGLNSPYRNGLGNTWIKIKIHKLSVFYKMKDGLCPDCPCLLHLCLLLLVARQPFA